MLMTQVKKPQATDSWVSSSERGGASLLAGSGGSKLEVRDEQDDWMALRSLLPSGGQQRDQSCDRPHSSLGSRKGATRSSEVRRHQKLAVTKGKRGTAAPQIKPQF